MSESEKERERGGVEIDAGREGRKESTMQVHGFLTSCLYMENDVEGIITLT